MATRTSARSSAARPDHDDDRDDGHRRPRRYRDHGDDRDHGNDLDHGHGDDRDHDDDRDHGHGDDTETMRRPRRRTRRRRDDAGGFRRGAHPAVDRHDRRADQLELRLDRPAPGPRRHPRRRRWWSRPRPATAANPSTGRPLRSASGPRTSRSRTDPVGSPAGSFAVSGWCAGEDRGLVPSVPPRTGTRPRLAVAGGWAGSRGITGPDEDDPVTDDLVTATQARGRHPLARINETR